MEKKFKESQAMKIETEPFLKSTKYNLQYCQALWECYPQVHTKNRAKNNGIQGLQAAQYSQKFLWLLLRQKAYISTTLSSIHYMNFQTLK